MGNCGRCLKPVRSDHMGCSPAYSQIGLLAESEEDPLKTNRARLVAGSPGLHLQQGHSQNPSTPEAEAEELCIQDHPWGWPGISETLFPNKLNKIKIKEFRM